MVSVVPAMVIWASPTGMVRVSPAPSEMTILPFPAWMFSLKVSTILLPTATPMASSAGVLLAKVGAEVSEGAAADVVASTFVALDWRLGVPSSSCATKYTSYAVLAVREVMAEKLPVNGALSTLALAAASALPPPEASPAFISAAVGADAPSATTT